MRDEKITYESLFEKDRKDEQNLPAAAGQRRGQSKGARILILDDDQAFRELLVKLLLPQGYQIWQASCAQEALTYLQFDQPDLAIVDYRLIGGLDGLGWIKKVRELGFVFPVVLCTGAWIDHRTFKWIRNMLQVTVHAQKPIVPAQFISMLKAMLPKPEESVECISEEEEMEVTRQIMLEARTEYILELDSQWAKLRESVENGIRDWEPSAWQEADALTHKLKGSSGSLGFDDLYQTCARLESLFSYLEPSRNTLQEILSKEIKFCLSQGDEVVSSITSAERKPHLVVSTGQDPEVTLLKLTS